MSNILFYPELEKVSVTLSVAAPKDLEAVPSNFYH